MTLTLPPSMVEEVVQKETPLTKHASVVAEASSPGLPAEMIERAARAILNEIYNANELVAPMNFDSAADDHRDECTRIALAALTAALGDKYVIVPREPTEAMIVGGNCRTSVSAQDNTLATWHAMIAARPGEDASATPTDCLVPSSLNQSNFSKHTG